MQGTRAALYANNRESITVTVQEVTPKTVGALIALYERAVGIYAAIVNINAYHQPGKSLFLVCLSFITSNRISNVFNKLQRSMTLKLIQNMLSHIDIVQVWKLVKKLLEKCQPFRNESCKFLMKPGTIFLSMPLSFLYDQSCKYPSSNNYLAFYLYTFPQL